MRETSCSFFIGLRILHPARASKQRGVLFVEFRRSASLAAATSTSLAKSIRNCSCVHHRHPSRSRCVRCVGYFGFRLAFSDVVGVVFGEPLADARTGVLGQIIADSTCVLDRDVVPRQFLAQQAVSAADSVLNTRSGRAAVVCGCALPVWLSARRSTHRQFAWASAGVNWRVIHKHLDPRQVAAMLVNEYTPEKRRINDCQTTA